MANIENRPFGGTWKAANRKTTKYVPDSLVYINGDLSVAGCSTCSGRVDLQKYITSVSVDPSVEGPATATLSLSVPFQMGNSVVRDGNLLIHTGLEVHIYFRGYFSVKGILSGTPVSQTGGNDLSDVAMYPYYLAFHGIMTDVSYEYSGGFHTMSISCADLLHFWQYQVYNTNAGVFGVRPANSGAQSSVLGHNFTGMSPYAIIYTLFRDVCGSAGGVAYALSQETNAAAISTSTGSTLYSYNMEYWSHRFSQTMTSLRMYGANGELYNAWQSAYLGTMTVDQAKSLSTSMASKSIQQVEKNPASIAEKKLIAANYNRYSTLISASADDGSEAGLTLNVLNLQAFVLDINNMGQYNFFESVYETKLDIANHVKEVSGFEFYQDVDGDIVFKPHFYNMDTSSSRVYCIQPEDIISFNDQEKEPECTVVNATSGHFQSTKMGGGLENEWGTRAEFIDFRLVAQYGWRPKTLGESSMFVNPKALFFACVAQLDVFNIGMRTASCSIPLRPELRPGYPVYVTHLDCFYYLQSMSHSFSFGGQSTTTLNLVGKRAKFFAPGKAPGNGVQPTVDNIDLSNPHLPPLPLALESTDGISKLQGFPNVVMTLDPQLVNPLSFYKGDIDLYNPDAAENIIQIILNGDQSILQVDTSENPDPDARLKGPWLLQTVGGSKKITLDALKAQTLQLATVSNTTSQSVAIQTGVTESTDYSDIAFLLNMSQRLSDSKFQGSRATASYLDLLTDLKATYNPGADLPGYYRYYSSSHPVEAQQGARNVSVSSTGVVSAGEMMKLTEAATVKQFVSGSNKAMVSGNVSAGIPIISGDSTVPVVTPTHKIMSLQIASWSLDHEVLTVSTASTESVGFDPSTMAEAYTQWFQDRLGAEFQVGDPITLCQDMYDAQAAFCKERANFSHFGTVAGLSGTMATTGDFKLQLQEACSPVEVLTRITSEKRSPAEQARALRGKYESSDHVTAEEIAALYKGPLGAAVAAVYPDEAAMTAVMTEQVANGQYLSKHMTGSALDIGVDPESADGKIINAAALSFEGVTTITNESGGKHIHVDISKLVSSTTISVDGVFEEGDYSFPTGFFEDAGVLNYEDVPGETDDDKCLYIAGVLAESLTNAVTTTLQNIKEGLVDHSLTLTLQHGDRESVTYTELTPQLEPEFSMAYNSCMPKGKASKSGIPQRAQQTTQTTKPHIAPVFPVSDARGYEVIGTYAYGRGVSIEPGGSFDKIQQHDRTSVTTLQEAENALNSIRETTDVSSEDWTNGLSVELRAQRLASIQATVSDTSDTLTAPDSGSTSHTNRPANSNQATQKLSVINAAYSLADMRAESAGIEICSCKAAEAATMLLSFTGTGFMEISSDNINQILQEGATSQVATWQAAQDAYRGSVISSDDGSNT